MEPKQIPNMSNVDLKAACRKAGACEDALAWLDDTGYDLQDAWDQCPNNDWRPWFLAWVYTDENVYEHYQMVDRVAWKFFHACIEVINDHHLDHPYLRKAYCGLSRTYDEMCKAAIVVISELHP